MLAQLLQTDLNHRNLPLCSILILTCHQTRFPSQLIQMEVVWSPIYACGQYTHQPSVPVTTWYTTVGSAYWRKCTPQCILQAWTPGHPDWLVMIAVSFTVPQDIIFLKWKWRMCELMCLPQIPCADPESTHSWFVKCTQFVHCSWALPWKLMWYLHFIYRCQDEMGCALILETNFCHIHLIW